MRENHPNLPVGSPLDARYSLVMEGVTTAIVAFILLCVAFPRIVKVKPQFYAAFFAVLAIILLQALDSLFASAAFSRLAMLCIYGLQIVALLLLMLSAGGMTSRELMGEMGDAIEVIRRGESAKEVIIPIRGTMAEPKRPTVYKDTSQPRPDGPTTYTITDPAASRANSAGGPVASSGPSPVPQPRSGRSAVSDADTSIPLE